MDARRDAWVEEERNQWQGLVETEWESFDPGSAESAWVFDDDEETGEETGEETDAETHAADTLTGGPGDTSETMLGLSRSLATAFLIADIGIRLTCLDHLFEVNCRGKAIGESLGRFFDTLCHSVEEDDRWRVETAIDCLRERLQRVAGFGDEWTVMAAELESLLSRLHGRCVPVVVE
jgi:hypothetical protein